MNLLQTIIRILSADEDLFEDFNFKKESHEDFDDFFK